MTTSSQSHLANSRSRAAACTAVLVIASLIAVLPADAGEKPLVLHGCDVQQVHAPFPAKIVRNSLPEGFRPLPYADLPIEHFADVPTTALICDTGGRDLVEEWSWASVESPQDLKDERVDAYGFFIHGFSPRLSRGASPWRCFSAFEEPEEIEMTVTEQASGVESRLVARRHGYTDEVWSSVDRAEDLEANTIRLFGLDHRERIVSVDVWLRAETALAGAGYYIQRGGDPSVDGLTFAAPGYFAGNAWLVEDTQLYITNSTSARC